MIQKEKGTCSPTPRLKGPQDISRTQSNPSGSSWKKSVNSNPSRESKWGFNIKSESNCGSEVWKNQALSSSVRFVVSPDNILYWKMGMNNSLLFIISVIYAKDNSFIQRYTKNLINLLSCTNAK